MLKRTTAINESYPPNETAITFLGGPMHGQKIEGFWQEKSATSSAKR